MIELFNIIWMNVSLKLISESTRWDFLLFKNIILSPSSMQCVLTGMYITGSAKHLARVLNDEKFNLQGWDRFWNQGVRKGILKWTLRKYVMMGSVHSLWSREIHWRFAASTLLTFRIMEKAKLSSSVEPQIDDPWSGLTTNLHFWKCSILQSCLPTIQIFQ